jgi:hypothetical protein
MSISLPMIFWRSRQPRKALTKEMANAAIDELQVNLIDGIPGAHVSFDPNIFDIH